MGFDLAVMLAPPIPAPLAARLRKPNREQREAPPDFEWDRPYAISQAYAEVERWIDRGEIMRVGKRDELAFKFFARMHGLGVGEERAFELFEYWIDQSGGDRPDDIDDGKIGDKIRRIWRDGGADNPPGSELPKRARDFVERLPDDRLWTPTEMLDLPPPSYWDDENLIIKSPGAVAIWFGKYGHHKTNFVLSKLFRLMLADDTVRVLYLLGEGQTGMGRRLAANAAAVGRQLVEFNDRLRLQRVPVALDPADVLRVLDMSAEFRPDIVILDTLASALPGQEEDNKTYSQLGRNGAIGRMADLLGCSLICIGHEGDKPGKLRGGSGAYGNVDQVVYVRASADTWARALKASTHAPEGKIKDDVPRAVFHGLSYEHATPTTFPLGQQAYELLSGDARFSRSSIGAALSRLEAGARDKAVGSLVLVRELYQRVEGVEPEEYERLLGVLAKALEKAAKEDNSLSGLSEVGADKQRLWFIA